MTNTMTLILITIATILAGCSATMLAGSPSTAVSEDSYSTDTVTTASGVKIDPNKHRAITYQMW